MLIFVLYDGINNSVFEGQVLMPLIKQLESGTANNVLVISFENKQPTSKQITALNTAHPKLKLITLKKYPFIGKFSLLPAIRSLQKILSRQPSYKLMARGPLAGFICTRAVNWNNCTSFTIQARGLLAQEYRYMAKDERNILRRLIAHLRIKIFSSLEITAYANEKITIEAVSPALKEYLVQHCGATAQNITIATHDLPPTFNPTIIASWRHEMRASLNIPKTAYVYCFNGSAKPWQCAPEVVTFFEQQYVNNKNNFLIVLTQDKSAFQALLSTRPLLQNSYVIMTVPHHDMYRYLAACDAGLIFREPSIVNWVSRPTKVLEYRAVGLKVIHNNTVAWLTK